MRLKMLVLSIPVLALVSFAAVAQSGEPGKPVTDKDVGAGEVAQTPVTDLNLKKDELPPLLIAAVQRPYTLRELTGCQQIAAAIGELDAVLGDDVDLPQIDGRRTSPGRVAQSVVGSFIPFRGVIREISGASERERQLQTAVLAGVARRSFLKGIGEARKCRYPARSATPEVFAARMAEVTGQPVPVTPAAVPAQSSQPGRSRFVSQPVVQKTN